MQYTEYADAAGFLAKTRTILERDECANNLMLGNCLRLLSESPVFEQPPLFATIDRDGDLALAAVMTPPYPLQIYVENGDVSGVDFLVTELARSGRHIASVIGRESVGRAFAELWSRETGAAARTRVRQLLYELRSVVQPIYPPGYFRVAESGDIELAREWARCFHKDCFHDGESERAVRNAEEKLRHGGLFFWVNGTCVSMAARTRPTPRGEAVCMVYTPPQERGRGYASAVVASLSQRILNEGKTFCTLYTDLDNPTSNSIYRRIGHQPVADSVHIEFE
ncbi:MAG: GNAT family N-acetyltransferase [Candidatus Hydrogenedentes bacterium]|nr:GNAT family N-acetyltransferase [Candidatus Hydrogenedentota bacterium]